MSRFSNHAVEKFKPLRESRTELRFLRCNNGPDQILVFKQFRIRIPVHADNDIDEIREKGVFNAENMAETDSAAENTAQDVTATLVGRQNAVTDHHRHGPDMVADNLYGNLLLRVVVVAVTDPDNFFHNGEQEIRFKIGFFFLNYGSQPFKTGTRINIFLFKRFICTFFCAVKLREHEIPYFQIPVAVATYGTGRFPAAAGFAEIIENLRIGTARPFSYFPKIIFQF